jgi:putative ABC transport system substrate-binding protein
MKRRAFLVGVVSSLSRPLRVRAQPTNTRTLGVLMNFRSDDPEGRARVDAFMQALRKLGWTEGANLRAEFRWAGSDSSLSKKYVQELVDLRPDAIFAPSTADIGALQHLTSSIPIVFANIIDPVGAGFVASLAHPGGNITGFTSFDYSLGGKWLEVLQALSPGLERMAVVRDPLVASGIGQFAAIQAFASSSGLEITAVDPHSAVTIDREYSDLARQPNGGVIVTASVTAVGVRGTLIEAAARHKLPAVYPYRLYVSEGGLASYGPDPIINHVRAAAYIDRILRGESPASLPVQTPNHYELAINLKAASDIGVNVPQSLLARADVVIE